MNPLLKAAEGPVNRLRRLEDSVSIIILAVMVFLPCLAVLVRWVSGTAMAGSNLWVQALNLWIAFTGGALAARTSRHLSLSTSTILKLEGRPKAIVMGFTSAVGTAVTMLLAYASVQLVLVERSSTVTLFGGVPMWLMQTIMPVGFGAMALRMAWRENDSWKGRVLCMVAVGLAFSLALFPPGERDIVVWGGTALIGVAVALGAPLYTAMGGVAMLLFFGSPLPIPISAVPAETYRIVASPTLPCLPLFTLAGYLLAEGGASTRLVKLFQAWFGWMPGGIATAAVLVCAFFTTFTGASGVTILALGGLLLPVLIAAGYSKEFSVGLLAASGSIGLLFPPSLPVILYGVVSHVPISDLFISGVVPGILLVLLLVAMCVFQALRQGLGRSTFVRQEALEALKIAKWEVLLPVLVLLGIFGGVVTIFEAAAMTAAYALLTEVVIHKDLDVRTDLPRIFVECATLMGGVLIILGVALGFTSYLIDAEIPMLVTRWVEEHVGSRVAFILLLNFFLLIVGCLMDIYSAIMVVVPLIVPIAAVFGIHPAHLGILFLANLELGYLTPPVGMNLFLASYRFEMPLTRVYRVALPFLGSLGLGVLFIAYVPGMTTWPHNETEERPPISPDEAEAAPELDPADLQKLLEDGPVDGAVPFAPLDLEKLLEETPDEEEETEEAEALENPE